MNTGFDKTKEAAETISETSQNIKDEVQDIGDALKDSTKKLGKEALHQANEWYDCTVNYIKTNPCKAIGIAVLFGFILAKWQK